MILDPQSKQILNWSGQPERAMHDFLEFSKNYLEKTGGIFELGGVNAKRLLTIFGNSHFLSQFLIRHPEQADFFLHSPYLEAEKKKADFQEELALLLWPIAKLTPEEFSERLLFYKYQEFLRITVRDLSEAGSQEAILNELSDLADQVLDYSLHYQLFKLSKSYDLAPLGPEWNRGVGDSGFVVIAQGKLGGREINYSSDVDLQYLYTQDGKITDSPREIGYHEFFVKLAEQLTRSLAQRTAGGFLYRVDLNLRPEGKSGTLANSLAALESYYESFGLEWERQALIKARPVAGDLKLGEEFLKTVSPFVWRKSWDLAGIEKLKEIKQKLHDSTQKPSPKDFHVKLDPGGIREIEFFVQILQLLYGGHLPELRTPSTLEAIAGLAKHNKIDRTKATQLKEAYLFLRKLEHRLQLVEESQTHVMSHRAEEQQALARRMNYFEEDIEDARLHFLDDLTRCQTFVKNNFHTLLQETT